MAGSSYQKFFGKLPRQEGESNHAYAVRWLDTYDFTKSERAYGMDILGRFRALDPEDARPARQREEYIQHVKVRPQEIGPKKRQAICRAVAEGCRAAGGHLHMNTPTPRDILEFQISGEHPERPLFVQWGEVPTGAKEHTSPFGPCWEYEDVKQSRAYMEGLVDKLVSTRARAANTRVLLVSAETHPPDTCLDEHEVYVEELRRDLAEAERTLSTTEGDLRAMRLLAQVEYLAFLRLDTTQEAERQRTREHNIREQIRLLAVRESVRRQLNSRPDHEALLGLFEGYTREMREAEATVARVEEEMTLAGAERERFRLRAEAEKQRSQPTPPEERTLEELLGI